MFANSSSQTMCTIAAAGLFVLFAAIALPAFADTFTWSNTGTDWLTGTNWANLAVPGAGDAALFNSGSYTGTQPNLSAATSVGGIWDTGAGSLTVTGNTLTLNGALINGGTDTTGIQLDSTAGSLTVSAPLVLGSCADLAQQLDQGGQVHRADEQRRLRPDVRR